VAFYELATGTSVTKLLFGKRKSRRDSWAQDTDFVPTNKLYGSSRWAIEDEEIGGLREVDALVDWV